MTPQQFVFRLTRHDPVPYDLNRRQAALRRLRYGCYHAGLWTKLEMLPFYRFQIDFLLWLKSPSPEPHINKGIE